jgi:hypothetical protein
LLARNGFDPDVCRAVAATVNHDEGTGDSDMEGADEP